MNLSIELYHLPNNYANWHTLLLNRAFSAYYAQYRYRSPKLMETISVLNEAIGLLLKLTPDPVTENHPYNEVP